jgi:hypothetical protein
VPKKILRRANELPFEWLRNITAWAGTAPFPVGEQNSRTGRASSHGSTGKHSGTNSSDRRQRTVRMEEGMESLAMVTVHSNEGSHFLTPVHLSSNFTESNSGNRGDSKVLWTSIRKSLRSPRSIRRRELMEEQYFRKRPMRFDLGRRIYALMLIFRSRLLP